MELSRRNFMLKSSLAAAGISFGVNTDLQAIENFRIHTGEIPNRFIGLMYLKWPVGWQIWDLMELI